MSELRSSVTINHQDTPEQVTLLLIQSLIKQLSKEKSDDILMCASRIRLMIDGYGTAGEVALALVAAEFAAR